MSEENVINRNILIIPAVIIQLCLGSIYAWSKFQTALVSETGVYGWDKLLTQLPFTVGLASFAGFMIFAGRWQDRAGPKKVATIGGILLGIGWFLAGFVDLFGGGNELLGFLWVALTYGLIGGAGIGFAYVCPIAALVKWFPDLKGLITGIAVAGFGLGAFFLLFIEEFLIEDVGNGHIGLAFWILGILFLVLVVGSAQILQNPPKGWIPPGYTPKPSQITAIGEKRDFEPTEMVQTPQFWLLWGMFILAAAAGLMTIGNVTTFTKDQLISGGISAEEASILAVTTGSFLSIFNSAGRIVWGAVSDKLGRIITMIVMFGTLGVAMFFFGIQTEFFLLIIGACIIGFCFGGNFALFPSATDDYFGTKNLGRNYGLVFTAYGVAGALGPFIAGVLVYEVAFPILGILAFLAAGLAVITEYLARRNAGVT
ncbi:MAG: OFA family MFS transporter [Candidatus Heimdallarchaeota archaeon]|nr:MAG: OFA family MFS transporter [Candidatus Heimdallarchaeota archaeon]